MDLERLQQALIAADAAGDVASATALAAAIRAEMARNSQALNAPSQGAEPAGGVSVDQQAAAELATGIGAGVMGLRNGVSMGLIDNLKGAVIGGIGGGVPTADGGIDLFNYGTPVGERYAGVRDQVRGENAQALEDAPNAYRGGNIVGGTVTSALALPQATASTFLGTAGRMAGIGALEGGLLGFGNADGQDTWESTLAGAGLGAVTGLLAPGAVEVARAVGRPVGGLLDAALGRANPRRAGVALARTVDRSGMTMDDIQRSLYQAELDGQPMFTVADALGNPGQRALSGVARAPGDGRTAIMDYLSERQLGQNERVSSFVSDALETPDTAAMRAAEARRARGLDAGVNYDAARDAAVPVDVRPALEIIEGRLGPLRGVDIEPSSIDRLLAQYNARLSVPASSLPPGTNSMELSDFSRVFEVKRDLRDDIEAATRAGRGGEALLLGNLEKALDDALARSSEGYSGARDVYRAQSQALDAVQTGREAARPSIRTDDALAMYRGLPEPTPATVNTLPSVPGGQAVPLFSNSGADAPAGFRVGYVDPLLARIENTPPTNNSIRQFLTPKNREVLAEIANDPALFARRTDREQTMFETGFAAMGGSKTADNLADAVDMEGIDLGLLGNLVQGRYGAAAAQLAQQGANAAKGMNEETRALIARALLSRDPQAALAPLLRQAMLPNAAATTAEAAIRQSAFQGLLAP